MKVLLKVEDARSLESMLFWYPEDRNRDGNFCRLYIDGVLNVETSSIGDTVVVELRKDIAKDWLEIALETGVVPAAILGDSVDESER